MFSNIHNSLKTNKHAATARLPAFLGAVIITVVAGSAPAFAHCERHVYNYSNSTWHFEIPGQPSNNIVDYYIQPGESRSFWIVTDGTSREIRLSLGGFVHSARLNGSSCHIDHSGDTEDPDFYNCFTWNDPADGDVSIGRARNPERCTNNDDLF